MILDDLATLVREANLAPSVHNTQPNSLAARRR